MTKANKKIRNVKKKKLDIIERAFGSWGPGPSGKEYVRKIREDSEKRMKRLKKYGL